MTNWDRIRTMDLEDFVDELYRNIPDEQDMQYLFGTWQTKNDIKNWLMEENEETNEINRRDIASPYDIASWELIPLITDFVELDCEFVRGMSRERAWEIVKWAVDGAYERLLDNEEEV